MASDIIIEGTTLVAFRIKIGTVLGTDSMARAAPREVGGVGKVFSRCYNKIFVFSHDLIIAMAGNLKVAEDLLTKTRTEWRKSVSNGYIPSANEIGDSLRNSLKSTDYESSGKGVYFLIASTDYDKMPILWEACQEFSRSAGFKAVTGSGGRLAKAILDEPDGTYNYNMTEIAAGDLALKAICNASIDDKGSGGDSVKVFIVQTDGVVKKLRDEKIDDLKKIYFPEGMTTDDDA